MHARSVRFIVPTVLALVVAACGGGDSAGDAGSEPTTVTTVAGSNDGSGAITEDEAEQSAEDLAESAAEALEGQQQSFGGGSARLVVGDESWDFARVLCAYGEEQIGAEGAEFVLSSLQDGLQLYVSIDSFGHSVSLNDISDFENPSVALVADGFSQSQSGGPAEFVQVDGKDIQATGTFIDETTDGLQGVEGTLQATCP